MSILYNKINLKKRLINNNKRTIGLLSINYKKQNKNNEDILDTGIKIPYSMTMEQYTNLNMSIYFLKRK